MTETLKIVAAIERYDGQTYELHQGPIPDDVPKAVVDKLRADGALESSEVQSQAAATLEAFEANPPRPDPTAVAHVDPDPGSPAASSGDGELPADAPDVASTEVADLANYIDSAKEGRGLNASETVALAKSNPELAAKVLEAEQVAHGGDGRSTVVGPLEKLRDSAGDGS